MHLQLDRPIPAVLSAVAGLVLVMQATISSQLVRTADATVRGLRENDFPRVVKLADDVYAYEDLNGDLKGNLAFTTNSLIVITTDGVVVADGQGSVAKTKRLVDRIKTLTPHPIKYVIVGADHGDHVAGNSAFPAGVTFIAHPTSRAAIEAMAARPQPTGAGPMPVPQETVADKRVLKVGSTELQILFLGRAHTGGDLEVFLPRDGILWMSEVFFNRIYPSVGGNRSGRPIEWLETVKKAQALNARLYVPNHGFIDGPEVLNEEFVNFRRALENLVSEGRRLHDARVALETAYRTINLGEFQYWYRAANNMPDAVRQIYAELDGQLK
jgi:glyoxylase-like metal-dependent hydrolase (beta-lactamase superfamily II)